MKIGRVYRFRACHSLPLPGYDEMHWHDYRIEVEGEGEPPYAVDMEAWDKVLMFVDHNLDNFFKPSTVEVIAADLRKRLGAVSVTVWEDDDRWARAE